MNIVFYQHDYSERGATRAILDYAIACSKYYNFTPTMLSPSSLSLEGKKYYDKFMEKFNTLTFLTHDASNLQSVLKNLNPDLVHYLQPGSKDLSFLGKDYKIANHIVFYGHVPRKQSHINSAFISEWSSKAYANGKIGFVPHIVKADINEPTESIYDYFNIPQTFRLIGRIGGYDQFNVPWIGRSIISLLDKYKDLVFLGINTKKTFNHTRAIFTKPILDSKLKSSFYNACLFTINARMMGETFGLAVHESLAHGTPCICYSPPLINFSTIKNKILIRHHKMFAANHILLLMKSKLKMRFSSPSQFNYVCDGMINNYSKSFFQELVDLTVPFSESSVMNLFHTEFLSS